MLADVSNPWTSCYTDTFSCLYGGELGGKASVIAVQIGVGGVAVINARPANRRTLLRWCSDRLRISAALFLFVLVSPIAGACATWGTVQDKSCTAVGIRTFASRIGNISSGQSWEAACASTPITIRGQTFPSPTRCKNTVIGGEWGEWDVADSSCAAGWGAVQDKDCTSIGKRTFASQIEHIPPVQT